MTRVGASIEIAAAPADVFRFCHDIKRRPEWDVRVVDVEMISSPPIRRGSLVRFDAGRAGQYQFTWEGEVTQYQMPNSSAVEVLDAAPSSPFQTGNETWEFTKTASGTRFVLTWVYHPKGILSRIRDILGGRVGARRAAQRSVKNLKTLLEQE